MVCSMDVTALYPSITASMASKAVKESITTSKLKWENINVTHLTRYVAVTCDRKTIKDDKLDDVVPTPVRTTTLNSMTNRTGIAKETNGDSQFIPAVRKPKENEIIKLIGHAIGVGIHACMENHVYRIEGNIRRQKAGGAIGSELTGETARNYMVQWDQKLRKKLKKLGIHTCMYARYVDDIVMALNVINKGWLYDKKKNVL